MIDSLLALLPAGGLPAVLAAFLIALVLVLRFLRGRRPRHPRRSSPPAPPDPPPSRSSRPARRALVVDDDPAAVRALARLLRADVEGLDVETAESGEEALAAVRAEAFDLLVVDVAMPGMGGPELVRRLRVEGSMRPLVHVVVVSGLDAAALETLARDCGASAWLAKPIDGAQLVALAQRLLRTA